ncbi:AAA family ATPase [Candidatus Woesearchaeota archaeon]|nr:AAA family ATPase [Candidatus Woesearchaeota archaeon]
MEIKHPKRGKKRMKDGISHYRINLKDLIWHADPTEFKFKSTADIIPPQNPIDIVKGQEKAKEILLTAIKLRENALMYGPPGCGKSLLAKTVAEQFSKENTHKVQLEDQLLVHNFENEWEPMVIKVPTPLGKEFRKDILTLRDLLPTLLARDDKKVTFDVINKGYEEAVSEELKESYSTASKKKIMETPIMRTQHSGLFSVKTTTEEVSLKRILEECETIPSFRVIDDVEKALLNSPDDVLNTPIIEAEMEGQTAFLSIKDLTLVGVYPPNSLRIKQSSKSPKTPSQENLENFGKILDKYRSNNKIIKYITLMAEDMQQNPALFKKSGGLMGMFGGEGGMQPMEKKAMMDKYTANLIVDNSERKGLPIEEVEHPSVQNILGEAGHDPYNMRPPHTRVKAGKLHRGNSGIVIIDELIVALQEPAIRNYLLTILQEKKGRIAGGSLGGGTSAGIETEPADADCIILGCANEDISKYLTPKISRRFRHKVEFQSAMENTPQARIGYAEFVKYEIDQHNKLPKNAENQFPHFSPEAVAALIELGVRFAQTTSHGKTKLTNILDPIGGIVKQASSLAATEKEGLVSRLHVLEAEKLRTTSMAQEQDERIKSITEGLILLDTEGGKVGIVNGLTVTTDKIGLVAFGLPVRVVATASKSTKDHGISSAEKDVGLGEKIHNKALHVINGYFNNAYGHEIMGKCYSTISFAQMYNSIDGDSASIATIIALKSAMSKTPVKQEFAVTGSINEVGEVQPIGGVNEKIEGFYRLCKEKGLTGEQGVIIPKSNVKDVMLSEELAKDYKANKFHIYGISHVDEAEEILLGEKGESLDKKIIEAYQEKKGEQPSLS